MSAPVDSSWSRIENWLATHAPRTHETLNPPARQADIDELEHTLGFAVPAPLTTLLLRRDGSGTELGTSQFLFPGAYGLASVALIRKLWVMYTNILDRAEDPEIINGYWWHRRWIPFAVANSGDALVIDTRPGPKTGQIGHHLKAETFFETWDSLPTLLAEVADGLEHGRPVDDEVPDVVDGELCWLM